MKGNVTVKVIKPPVGRISSGRIFKPAPSFLYKLWVKGLALLFFIWLTMIVGFVSLALLLCYVEPLEYPSFAGMIGDLFGPITIWVVGINLVWLVPLLVLAPSYARSIEYSVISESGQSMPEIYVKKGIVTVTRKHVPFRTITNISSDVGPFDRMFRIGSVSIETAGYSGTKQTGPEEKLEGIVFYEEVRDFILNELRRYRAPYALGTEVVPKQEEPVPRTEGLDDEILLTLREIRDLLRMREQRDD